MNGLQEDYGAQVAFLQFNALDNAAGERLFDQLSLPGHPVFLIYAADGRRTYQGVGIISVEQLQREITAAIGGDSSRLEQDIESEVD